MTTTRNPGQRSWELQDAVRETQPAVSERSLRRSESRFMQRGWQLLLLGGAVAAIGLALAYSTGGVAEGIGVMLASLASAPTLAGIVLVIVSAATGRMRRGEPFA